MHERKRGNDHVAKAVYESLNDTDEAWSDMSDEEKAPFVNIALAASAAYQELLEDLGVRIVPPGMMVRPKSDIEAAAMIKAAKEWLDQPEHTLARRKQLVKAPALILPGNMTRQ